MKKKINMALACLAFCGMLTYSPLPVQAMDCSHQLYIENTGPELTGVCTYNESGHQVEYGTRRICTKCGLDFFVDMFTITEEHQWASMYSEWEPLPNGARFIYDCTTSGCHYRNYVTVTYN